jgi:hypothetical protein
MGTIVSTERLGRPGSESGRWERKGLFQNRLIYPTDSNVPTATCHVQPDAQSPALCGFNWESLVAVPDVLTFDQIEPALRCP